MRRYETEEPHEELHLHTVVDLVMNSSDLYSGAARVVACIVRLFGRTVGFYWCPRWVFRWPLGLSALIRALAVHQAPLNLVEPPLSLVVPKKSTILAPAL